MPSSPPFAALSGRSGCGGLAKCLPCHGRGPENFSWPKILLLLASIAIVIFLLFRAGRELYAAGAKALSAFVTLVRDLAKAIPPIMLAGAAAGAGAWIVNHVQL